MATRSYPRVGLLLLLVFVGCNGSTSTDSRPELLVLAAASTRDALQQVVDDYQQDVEGTIRISTGSSSALAEQILAGAPADLFISANPKWAEVIDDAGLAQQRRPLLTNRIVLIVPQGNPANVTSLDDLLEPRVARVAIAGSQVPAGMYAEQALRHAGVFEQLEPQQKLVRGSDVRVVLAYVERGEAEAGIVYATDALQSQQVEVVLEIDASSHEPVVYWAVLLKDRPAAAAQLFEALWSPDALAAFQQHGFSPYRSSEEAAERPEESPTRVGG